MTKITNTLIKSKDPVSKLTITFSSPQLVDI